MKEQRRTGPSVAPRREPEISFSEMQAGAANKKGLIT
jgi:hypothetical protein